MELIQDSLAGEDIARRMDNYRKDDLMSFDYRRDPNTPKQYVICANTRLSGNCVQVVTLMPNDDPYKSLQEVAGALLDGSPASYQSSGKMTPNNTITIPLQDKL